MISMIYSSDTIDGVCAAACIVRGLRIKGFPARFAGTLSPETPESVKDLTDQANCALLIVDYPPENIPNLPEVLKKIVSKATLAYWNFTQPQQPETLALLGVVKRVDYAEVRLGSVQRATSTELVASRFIAGDPVGKQLANLAADIKFWLRQDDRATKLADLLVSGFDKRTIVDSLSKGIVWDDKFEAARNEYLEKKTKALEDLMKRLTIKEILGKRYGFTIAPALLSTADAGQYILDKHAGVDVSVALYRSGKIAFRSREGTDVDLANLAKQFQGGGRKYASGGLFSEQPITVENWENVLGALDRKLKTYFLS